MNFQRARTEEQIANRQDEIIRACDLIFTTKGYEEVSFKTISEITSVSRPAIYKYYETREEIFLDLLTDEYLNWRDELKSKFDTTDNLSKKEYCLFLASSLAHHEKMLELLSIHLPNIENNSRMERLVQFKKNVMTVMDVFSEGLNKFFPSSLADDKNAFQMHFFAYIYGLYPFTHHTKKQIEAMHLAEIAYEDIPFEKFCYNGLLLLAAF